MQQIGTPRAGTPKKGQKHQNTCHVQVRQKETPLS